MNNVISLAPTIIPSHNNSLRDRVDIELNILKAMERQLPCILETNRAYFEENEDCALPLLAKMSHQILVENQSQFATHYQEILNKVKLKDNPEEDVVRELFYVIKKEMISAIYTNLLGVKILKWDFSFSAEDLNRAGLGSLHFFSDDTIDCTCFALYHQNDVVAIQSIFKDQQHIDLEYLRSNYICVQEPLPGDIVIYSNGIHYGIWKGDGKVLSKWGQGPIIEHRLEEVPLSYGETVLFFRKKRIGFPSQERY